MSNDVEGLIRLNKSNAKPAVEVLVRAFRNYPLLQYYFPSEVEREKISYYFLSFAVFTGISYGEVYATSPNLEGVAVWIPSANYPVTFWRLLRSVPPLVIFGLGTHGGSKMRRLGEYIDTVHQRKLLHDALDSLVIPEADVALRAGELLEGLGLIWNKATDEDKHRLLSGMIEAIYIDLVASRSIVGIQPKPPFYNLFESLKQIPDNKVTVFRPGEEEKITGSGMSLEPDFKLVETGESRTPRPKEAAQNMLQT